MEATYGDLVMIDGSYYLYLENGYHDINGGGVLAITPTDVQLEVNLGIVLNSYLSGKIADTEAKLNQVKTVLE
jgi:hypothetical protein